MSLLHRRDEVTSTNDVALELARDGAPSGTLVVAKQQSHGRGRNGRTWFSPPGGNLYLSCVHRSRLPLDGLAGLTLDAAAAVATALEDLAGLEPELKWPNDVLVEGAKIAGLLTELHVEGEPSDESVVIVGVGLNVNLSLEQLPPALRTVATSLLLATGKTWDPDQVEALVARRIREKLSGYEFSGQPDLVAFTRRFGGRGRRARVQGPDGPVVGTILGVLTDGALEVSLDDGTPWRVRSGEVQLLDPGAEESP